MYPRHPDPTTRMAFAAPLRTATCQRGAMTLFMVLVILTLMAGWAILSLRFNGLQAWVAASETRAEEARQAADAGLEYALAWLGVHRWQAADGVPQVPAVDADPARQDSPSYRVELALERRAGGFIHVHSLASGPDGSQIRAGTSRWLVQSELFSEGMSSELPPLVVDGCLYGGSDISDLYPQAIDQDGDGITDSWGDALHSSRDLLLEPGCVDLGGIDAHGGQPVHPAAFTGEAWDYAFGISKADIRALSDAQQAAGLDAESTPPRTFYWVDADNAGELLQAGAWSASVGSPAQPVMIAFAAELGCPGLQGAPEIHGVLYFAAEPVCELPDWGGATVYGSLVFEGSLYSQGGSIRLHQASQAEGGGLVWPALGAAWLPGSWRDF